MQKLIVYHHARVVLATVLGGLNLDTNYEKLELNTWKSFLKDLQPSKIQKTNFCAALNERKNFIFRHEWKRKILFFGKVLPSFECKWYWDSIPDLMHGNFIFFPSHFFFHLWRSLVIHRAKWWREKGEEKFLRITRAYSLNKNV